MFEQAVENLRKATEASAQVQQEMFKKWISMWPGAPAAMPSWGEQIQKFQKKWSETVNELLKRQREVVEAQFKAGMQNIDKAFQLGEVKTPEELRAKSLELWQQCFESLRQAYEVQMREFQTALEKWVELTTKAVA